MKKIVWLMIVAVIVLLAINYFKNENPVTSYNNYCLKQNILATSKTEVTLNELVPFEWDTVYTFDAYITRSEIEKTIGFESNAIQDTVDAGRLYLLFVKDDTICGSVYEYPEDLGYNIDFNYKVEFEDKVLFDVRKRYDIVTLTRAGLSSHG